MIAWIATALAASWSVPAPLSDVVSPDGTLELAAGVAVRLAVAPGAPLPRVTDAAGAVVVTRGAEGGLLVPAAASRRTLRVEATQGVEVRVSTSDDPSDAAAWELWSFALEAALDLGEPPPPPPWGGGAVGASMRLRALATLDPALGWLGAQHDVAGVRPLMAQVSFTTTDETPLPPGSTARVVGPGVAVVRTRPPEGPLVRYTLQVALDGVAQPPIPQSSTGAAPVAVRVWIPPGEHILAATVPPDTFVSVVGATLRPRAGWRWRPPTPAAGTFAEAETAWLSGASDPAAFRPFLAHADARGELARARVLALTEDPAEAATLAVPPPDVSPDGLEVLADAALSRADLADDLVLALLARAADPDAERVAAWVDRLGGTRPRGQALLQAAGPDVPVGVSPALRALRHGGLVTRWTRVGPPADARTVTRRTEDGPGVPRVLVESGAAVALTLPARMGDRVPVLRILAEGPVRYRLDGQALASPGGALDVALPAGAHTLEVDDGALLLLDADVVSEGGARVFEWGDVALPARWTLPDPGGAVDLRVEVNPPGPVVALFDDGPVVPLVPLPDGSLPGLVAGPHATSVELRGEPGARAGLAMRTLLDTGAEAEVLPVVDEATALDELRRLTSLIDAGSAEARLERARLLGALGLLGASRRDLAVILAGPDVHLARVAGRVATAVSPEVPSAPVAGPVTVPAALAAAGLPVADPGPDAVVLEDLARRTGQPALWVAAARVRLDDGSLDAALVDLELAGPTGRDVAAALEPRLRWRPVARADRSAGLVPVRTTLERLPADAPLWRLAADAMLTSPWPPEETLVLRGDSSDLVHAPGRRFEVALFCRDEDGPGEPCRVPVRFDAATSTVEVRDGAAPTRLSFDGGPGAHEVEVGGPGRGQALVVRATVDGVLVPPGAERLAVRAAPGQPVIVDVATPAVLRVTRAGGDIAIGGRPVEDERVVPLAGDGVTRVEITGNGQALLARATLGPARPPVTLPEPPPDVPRVSSIRLDPVLARFSAPASPPRRMPGAGPTWGAGAFAGAERVEEGVTWVGAGTEGSAARVAGWGFATGRAWVAGPGVAAGGEARLGRPWEGGHASATLSGGWSTSGGGVGLGEGVGAGSAGGIGLALRGRHDVVAGPSDVVRLQARLRVGYWTPDPGVAVDPAAWNAFASAHPVALRVDASHVRSTWRDLRLEAGIGALVDFGPWVDTADAWAVATWLVSPAWLVDGRARVGVRLPDDDRARAEATTELNVGGAWVAWRADGRRLEARFGAGLEEGSPEATLGVGWLWTGGRGLHDRPPDTEVFRTVRGMP